MEPIRETMKRVVNAPSFSERYEAMKKEVLEHPGVLKFLKEHEEEIDGATVEKGWASYTNISTNRTTAINARTLAAVSII